ncbi:hypothetical protein Scep_023993 [Stephania cephalantha]|uniref:CCR4-NOT transcription complex subunit 10 n=1 Tax=Stephania cephalantha TaxID=152367 RepID=A0AAP0F169_9MAGN
MDSRDLSATSAATASRDGSPSEEDAILSVTAGLAKEAALLFQSRRYSECIDVLNQVMQKKPSDPKVLHNITVAEYFRDGCSDPKKLLEVLHTVKRKSEELARASVEQGDVGNTTNSVTSGSKGSTTIPHQFSTASSTSNAYSDEFDTSLATLNIAVVLFNLHDFAKALSVLEPLYQNIEPIDEATALHICLLLLDVALASHDAARAAEVIQYLEKASGGNCAGGQGDNGSNTHQSSNTPVKSSASCNSASLNVTSPDNAATGSSENPLSRTLSDEALDYETLLSTLDIGGQNLSRAPTVLSTNDLSRSSADRPAPAVDLKLKLHLYKVRLLLLTRNLKATKREVKLAMNIARGKDSSTALLLKSQLEYARGNHPKAIKLLNTSISRTESGMSSIFNNNLGCIFHQLKKCNMSAKLFSKALALSSSCLQSEKPLKLSTFSQDKSVLIVYNCGLQYLICGKPVLAAQCFKKASSVFYNQPLLWLRISECCLLALEKGLLDSISAPNDEVRVHVVGKGKWRQLVMDRDSSMQSNDIVEDKGLLSGNAPLKLSISFARRCLLNALHLLNGTKSKSSKPGVSSALEEDDSNSTLTFKNPNHKTLPSMEGKGSSASAQVGSNGDMKDPKGAYSLNVTLQNSVSSYEDICRREKCMTKQAVLANLAYVELFLGNPLKALSAAKSLLSLPECSRIYMFLGHVYAAEALCLLNRPKEAAEHLLAYLSDKNDVELPYSDVDSSKWKLEKAGDNDESNGPAVGGNMTAEDGHDIVFLKPEEGQGTLYVNLAAVSAIQGDLEQAFLFVTKALAVIPNNPKAILAAVYVDLLLGKPQDALVKLKQCNHVRYLSSSLPLNGCS